MKRTHIILTIISLLLSLACAKRPVISCDIPADFPEARRQQLAGIFEKGKELYKINCSECHGIYGRGKDSIPNFGKEQFDNYKAKFLMGDPRNHAVLRKMNGEQLDQIFIFLRYKKVSWPGKKDEQKT
ncbi:MAG: hypothetical protein BGO69_19715 [Bacteroidetes bacterium 46-16]|nr:MAG: hypothetical protein BGO69_19715 [Bacteroidetes bacterium 46-16]